MDRKGFVVGMVVGAVLATGGYVVGTVDARPTRPSAQSKARSVTSGTRVVSEKKTAKAIPVVVRCPDTLYVSSGEKVVTVPTGWTASTGKPHWVAFQKGMLTTPSDNTWASISCNYEDALKKHVYQITKSVTASNCTLSQDTKQMDCTN